MRFSASCLIGGGIVAEKSAVWRPDGQRERIVSTSSRKPRSSISSASSSTTKRAVVRTSAWRPIRSITRPTVPTTTCAFSFSARHLVADRRAAEDGHDRDALALAVRAQRLRDLDAQLARRRQDERLDLRVARVDVLEQRQPEGGGLARAGLRLADHVAALEQRGDRLLLDRGRLLVAEVRKCLEQRLREPEFAEGRHA